MANAETNLQARILISLSEAGCLVWRQDTGAFRAKSGALVRYGLCVGSSDIIGIAPDGRFLAVEVKTDKGRASAGQLAFIDAVRAKGARAGIARSEADAVAIATD